MPTLRRAAVGAVMDDGFNEHDARGRFFCDANPGRRQDRERRAVCWRLLGSVNRSPHGLREFGLTKLVGPSGTEHAVEVGGHRYFRGLKEIEG